MVKKPGLGSLKKLINKLRKNMVVKKNTAGSFRAADNGKQKAGSQIVSRVTSNKTNQKKQRNSFAEDSISKKRFNANQKKSSNVFKRFFASVFNIGRKKTNGNAALAFAERGKRLGKKGRRKRQIALYAGTATIVIVVLLVVVLVPGGEAASLDNENSTNRTSVQAADALVLADGQMAYEVEEATEEPTETAIQTTSPDTTAAPTEESTVEPTEESTVEPTEEATPEPTEEATPVPTTEPDPTPTPIDMDELVNYYLVEADLYYNDVGYSSNHYEYTEDELYMLAQIIQSEAGGESYEGKIAVGNVVMNRVLSNYPGDTITEVVTAANQFAYDSSTTPSSGAKAAARDILDFEVWVIPQNIYFFKATSSTDAWGSHAYACSIGGHAFYSESYSGRYRGDAVPPALFERTYKWPRSGCKPEKRVYRIQYMLNGLGYDVYADSYFGEGTKEALMEFQSSQGLKADGIAGPTTIEALIEAYGVEEYYAKFCE